MFTLETLPFDNTYARLPPDFYRRVEPTPLPAPYPVISITHAFSAGFVISKQQRMKETMPCAICSLTRRASMSGQKNYRARLMKEQSIDAERSERMKRVNPKYILRNHIAQQAIEQAQRGDYAEVNTLLEVLQRPFDEQTEMERFAEPPPEGSRRVVVSYSS